MSDFATLEMLMKTIQKRLKSSDKTSGTCKLVAKGREKICQKVGEEAVELGLAAVQDRKKDSLDESADLLYHLCVLWVDMDLSPKELMEELRRREGLPDSEEKKKKK